MYDNNVYIDAMRFNDVSTMDCIAMFLHDVEQRFTDFRFPNFLVNNGTPPLMVNADRKAAAIGKLLKYR